MAHYAPRILHCYHAVRWVFLHGFFAYRGTVLDFVLRCGQDSWTSRSLLFRLDNGGSLFCVLVAFFLPLL